MLDARLDKIKDTSCDRNNILSRRVVNVEASRTLLNFLVLACLPVLLVVFHTDDSFTSQPDNNHDDALTQLPPSFSSFVATTNNAFVILRASRMMYDVQVLCMNMVMYLFIIY